MPNYIRVKQINQAELTGFFVDSISSQSGLLLGFASGAAYGVASGIILNETVLLTGNQTISGIKTFSQPIYIATGVESVGSIYGTYVLGSDSHLKIVGINQNGDEAYVDIEAAGNSIVLGEGTFNINNGNGSLVFNGGDNIYIYNTRNLYADNITASFKNISSQTGTFQKLYANNLVYNTGNQTISGVKTFIDNVSVSGTGIFNALDLNNIDNLSLSGVDITITSGSVNINTSLNINGISINPYQPEFPAWTGIRRYSHLGLESVATITPQSGIISYFPFLIKKNVTNPVACVEMTTYSTNDPKINIGIYSGHYGFENARLITSGSITGNINYTGIYRKTLNGNFSQGPYILASVLETGQGSSFRGAGSQGIREHIGINTGNLVLHGIISNLESNAIYESGINNNLKINIGTGIWSTSSAALGPIVFLEY